MYNENLDDWKGRMWITDYPLHYVRLVKDPKA